MNSASKCPNASLQMHCTKLLWLAKYQDLHCGTVLTNHKRKENTSMALALATK